MECCGENHKTPFCPYCGNQLKGNPRTLFGLLSYVEGHAHGLFGQLKEAEKDKPSSAPKYQRAYNKWQGWYEDLRELIERDRRYKASLPKETTEEGS